MQIKTFKNLDELHMFKWTYQERQFMTTYIQQDIYTGEGYLNVYLMDYTGLGRCKYAHQMFRITLDTLDQVNFLGLTLERLNLSNTLSEPKEFLIEKKLCIIEESKTLSKFLENKFPNWKIKNFFSQNLDINFNEYYMYYDNLELASDYKKYVEDEEDFKTKEGAVTLWISYIEDIQKFKVSMTIYTTGFTDYNKNFFSTIRFTEEVTEIMKFLEDELNKEEKQDENETR